MHGMNRFKNVDDFVGWVLRKLGAPTLKVELTRQQIIDCINDAVDLFIRYADGQASETNFYTLMLSGGQDEYELPEGVIDVLDFADEGYGNNGINTLFTMQNQMWNAGLLDFRNLNNGMTLVNYHMALDFIEVIERYTNVSFTWKYNEFNRVLQINPVPESGNSVGLTNPETGQLEVHDSPGWVLLRLKTLPGAFGTGWKVEDSYLTIYNAPWVRSYTLALAKMVLGEVREKFESYASVGNTGIVLNGGQLKGEGLSEKEVLEDKLKLEEAYTGYGITTGIIT